MSHIGPSGWELALTAGIVSLAVALGEERKAEILARAALPQEGWERDVRRSCDRNHLECHGFGVCYELHHKPRLRLEVVECACVKYEVVYSPILIPSDRMIVGVDLGAGSSWAPPEARA